MSVDLAAVDGGAPTHVTLVVESTGVTRVVFTRDGHEVTQNFIGNAVP